MEPSHPQNCESTLLDANRVVFDMTLEETTIFKNALKKSIQDGRTASFGIV